MPHGATHLHTIGVDGYVRYNGREGSFEMRPTDAPIVSIGLLSPFPTPGRFYGRYAPLHLGPAAFSLVP